MQDLQKTCRIAVIQAEPILFDKAACTEKCVGLIRRAAEKGAAVTVLERFQKPGKKLLATGNGRCNLCNSGAPVYFGQSTFALKVLEQMPAARVMRPAIRR